jgi:hypothetical protein
MKKKEILSDLLLILCVFVLFVIPWTFVFGVKNEALIEAIGVFQRIIGFLIITFIVLKLVYKIYGKSLSQEMKEEKIKEANQKDKKQSLFKPTIGVIIFFLFVILLGIWGFIYGILLKKPNEDVFVWIISSSFLIGISLWLWYTTPVFIFAEDSVQIKSFLFYIFGIDRKTIIRYADITSVRPYTKEYGRYVMGISVRGTKKRYSLAFFNSDVIAQIYLRFKEKMGDRVIVE